MPCLLADSRSVFHLKCRHWQCCPLLKQHSYTLTRQGHPFLEDLTQRPATVPHWVICLLCISGYCAIVCLWVCLSGWILRAYDEVSLAIYPQGLVHCWKQCEFNRCLLKEDLLSDWVGAPHSLLDPPPSQRKGVKRSSILRPLPPAPPLQQAGPVTISRYYWQVPRLLTLSGPCLSQSCCRHRDWQ